MPVSGLLVLTFHQSINTLRTRQNGRRFADDTFKRIFFNENVRISIKISLKIVPKGPINNNPALVQMMAWHRPGDKPLSEPTMVSLLTHICVLCLNELNLFMLNVFQQTEECFCIFYHFPPLRWCSWFKSFLIEGKDLFTLHVQYHGYWRHVAAMS